jgi:protein ImuB
LIEGPTEARSWLAGRPVDLLGFREQTAALVEPLTRLGVRTLGELVKLGRPALADRFGASGALAHRLACGEDTPLHARRVEERLEESMEVGDASSGTALKGVLGVLVSRLLARPERRGRTLRAVTLSARLLAGGGWRESVVFREALSDPERIWLALSLRLLLLPAPAGALRLSVASFGPPANEQGALLDQEPARRAARLREAIAQVRTVAGQEAALRAVCVDPDSRVPERRVMLAPIPE